MKRAILDTLLAARRGKRPVALVTDLDSGLQTVVYRDAQEGGQQLDDETLAQVRTRIGGDKSGVIEREGTAGLFVRVVNPPLRLIVVGAVHIAQALVPMAGLAGYGVTVVDPRTAFATAGRFPGVALNTDWPDDALKALAPDTRTAVVTLTHDPKLDDPALEVALKSDAFYIGALGSRRTHAGRVERLTRAGFAGGEIARIDAPIGLDIGAQSPGEIAVSVMGQMTATLRGKTG